MYRLQLRCYLLCYELEASDLIVAPGSPSVMHTLIRVCLLLVQLKIGALPEDEYTDCY